MRHACPLAPCAPLAITANRAAVFVLAAVALVWPGSAPAATLPFGQSMAQGHELPLPFGIGVTYYNQNQRYKVDHLEFLLPGAAGISSSQIGIENRIREANVQFDAWLLPYLNVFVMVGQINGHTDVDLGKVNLGLPFSLGKLAVNYSGTQYGGGLTLAAGGEGWFSSLTAVTTTADLGGDFDSKVEALVVMPRVGLVRDRGSVWVGVMYQKADEKHHGVFQLPYIGPVPFAVELSQKNEWNGLVGMHAELAKHWTLELEGGFGSRRSASTTLAYRF